MIQINRVPTIEIQNVGLQTHDTIIRTWLQKQNKGYRLQNTRLGSKHQLLIVYLSICDTG